MKPQGAIFMPWSSRRLDDRIREMCGRIAVTENPEELRLILPELRNAIHEAVERLRRRAIAVLTKSPDIPRERRKSV